MSCPIKARVASLPCYKRIEYIGSCLSERHQHKAMSSFYTWFYFLWISVYVSRPSLYIGSCKLQERELRQDTFIKPSNKGTLIKISNMFIPSWYRKEFHLQEPCYLLLQWRWVNRSLDFRKKKMFQTSLQVLCLDCQLTL